MNEIRRVFKKTQIAIIWFLFLAFFYYILYQMFSSPQVIATCFDKIKNQNEEDVDCGGVCVPCKSERQINISNVNILRLNNNYYRVIFEAENLNPDTAYKSVEYKIIFKGGGGGVVEEKYFSEFLNQFEKRFVLSPAFLIFDDITDAAVEVAKLIKSDKKPVFLKNLVLEKEPVELDESDVEVGRRIIVRGHLFNDSVINYKEVEVIAIFYDSRDTQKIVTAGSTILYDIEPFKRRDFEITIPVSSEYYIDLNNLLVYAYVNFSKHENL